MSSKRYTEEFKIKAVRQVADRLLLLRIIRRLPSSRGLPLGRHPGQALDNTQGRKPRGRVVVGAVVATALWGFKSSALGMVRSRRPLLLWQAEAWAISGRV